MPLSMRLPSPDVVKIDVEGAESEVLRAAPKIPREVRPSIYCDLSEEQRDTVVELLKLRHYVLCDGKGFQWFDEPMVECTSFNIVAVPERRVRRQ